MISVKLKSDLMVMMITILGMLPLALGTGLGSELSRGIGIASVGGIAVSAFLTLAVLPILYQLLTSRKGAAHE